MGEEYAEPSSLPQDDLSATGPTHPDEANLKADAFPREGRSTVNVFQREVVSGTPRQPTKAEACQPADARSFDERPLPLTTAMAETLPTVPTSGTANSSARGGRTLDRSSAPSPKLLRLQSQIANLQRKICLTEEEVDATISRFKRAPRVNQISRIADIESGMTDDKSDEERMQALSEAEMVVKKHIRLLHDYNEIRDVGLGLCGVIADMRGVRLQAVLDEYGMGAKD